MAVKRNQLSKSTLIRSIQCPKSLYLYKNHYELRDTISASQQQIFERGIRVGKLAQDLFPGGKDVSPPNPYSYDASIAATKALVLQQHHVIYEASFKYHGIMAALDILVCRNGKWYAYEVKSSMRISHTYLLDCAIQYHIITGSGLPLEDFRIIHVNSDYVKDGEVEIDKLFTEKSVLEDILGLLPYVRERIEIAADVLSMEQIPEMPIGVHCTKPYACDFQGYCWKNVPPNSVWYLPGISMQEKSSYFEKGITTIDELRISDVHMERNKIVLETYKSKRAHIHHKELNNFFSKLNYPLYFFDLEAFQPVIPLFDGTRPFERIPFLYSLHYMPAENSIPEHIYHIAVPEEDPRELFIQKFLDHTERPGHILVFNTLMEKSILNKLSEIYPHYRAELLDRISRITDLEIPFKNMWYYHPDMGGSFSLKSISKAMLFHDPFDDSEVKDGETAMAMYNELFYERDYDKRAAVLRRLVQYCKADTLALVEIFQKIRELSR